MIDKSLRSKYAWGGPGGKSPGTSASGGSRNGGGGGPPGGGDRQMTYSAPAPSPDRQDRAREQAAAEQAAAERQEAERANQLAEARKLMTQPTTVDVPTKGPELIPGTTHPFVVDPYQQNYISPGKVRTTGIYNEGDYDKLVKAPVDVGFQEALRKQQIATDLRQKQQDPDYGQFFRPQPVVETPKTGIGGALKTMGKGILETALMPFLPKPVRTAWSGYKRAKQLEGLAKRTGILDKDIVPTLNLSNLRPSIDKGISGRQFDPKDPIGWTGEQKRTFHEGKGDGPKTIAEQVTQGTGLQSGQDLLGLDDKQIQQIYQGRDLLSTTIEAGVYQGKQLTAAQIKLLQNKQMELNKLIEAIEKAQAPVNVAYGGRIDKALGGRSRDI